MESNLQINFISSHSLKVHPLTKSKNKTRLQYYLVLDYIVSKCVGITEYTAARLFQYHTMLVGNETVVVLNERNRNDIIRSMIGDRLRPWMWRYRFWLMCDISLIVGNKTAVVKAKEFMRTYLTKRQYTALSILVDSFFNDDEVPKMMLFAEDLIHQFRINRRFAAQQERRILITANMSAGKSTLINALVGKQIVRTSQEACTANLYYLFNKPVEDDSIHIFSQKLKLDAAHGDLMKIEQAGGSHIATYFHSFDPLASPVRMCLIDTPGVNSAINREHGKRTRHALQNEHYDKLIYVLNANQLGTDEEIRYLKYISENVSEDKIIFVLNKLDNFKSADDSIAASIDGIQNDLAQLGFENPVIYPLSAYFALLLKLKQNGELLTEDEQDEYDYYVKKFSRSEYDLSKYMDQSFISIPVDNEQSKLAVRCGLYALENILYGGNDQ